MFCTGAEEDNTVRIQKNVEPTEARKKDLLYIDFTVYRIKALKLILILSIINIVTCIFTTGDS